MKLSKIKYMLFMIVLFGLYTVQANAFNGVILSKSHEAVISELSTVIVSRRGNRTVITMQPYFSAVPEEFGVILPVPYLISNTQFRQTSVDDVLSILEYSAPRLSQFQDLDLCNRDTAITTELVKEQLSTHQTNKKPLDADIDIKFLNEYNIDIESFLSGEGFIIDKNTSPILANLSEQEEMKYILLNVKPSDVNDSGYLQPIQIAYEGSEFILPLGLSNQGADKTQDLTVIFLTHYGGVEPDSMKLSRMPTEMSLPLFVSDDFNQAYDNFFNQALVGDNFQSMHLEYAGDLSECIKCYRNSHLPNKVLRSLGVWWFGNNDIATNSKGIKPKAREDLSDVYLTRYRFKYTGKTLSYNMGFKETEKRPSYAVRYQTYKPFLDEANCESGDIYKQSLPERYNKELQNYVAISGKNEQDIKILMEENGQSFSIPRTEAEKYWWEPMWNIER